MTTANDPDNVAAGSAPVSAPAEEATGATRRYELRTLKDVFDQVPRERIRACLTELGHAMELAKTLGEAFNAVAALEGASIAAQGLVWPDVCPWVDDGRDRARLNIRTAEMQLFTVAEEGGRLELVYDAAAKPGAPTPGPERPDPPPPAATGAPVAAGQGLTSERMEFTPEPAPQPMRPRVYRNLDGRILLGAYFNGTPGGACAVFEAFPDCPGRFCPDRDLTSGRIEVVDSSGELACEVYGGEYLVAVAGGKKWEAVGAARVGAYDCLGILAPAPEHT